MADCQNGVLFALNRKDKKIDEFLSDLCGEGRQMDDEKDRALFARLLQEISRLSEK